MTSKSPDEVIAARKTYQVACENLESALRMLPPANGDTWVASDELAQVLNREKTAKHHLQTLE